MFYMLYEFSKVTSKCDPEILEAIVKMLALAEMHGAKRALAALYDNMKDEMSDNLRNALLSLLSDIDDLLGALERETATINYIVEYIANAFAPKKEKASPKAAKSNS